MNCLPRHAMAIVVAMALGTFGCGEVTLPGGGVDAAVEPDAAANVCSGAIAADRAVECWVSGICDTLGTCFGESMSPEQCRKLSVEFLDLDVRYADIVLGNALTQGTLVYDSAAFGQCLAALRAITCDTLFFDDDPLDACRAYIGTVAEGGSCNLDIECAVPGSTCQAPAPGCGDAICCPGTCASPAPAGASCAAQPCADGSYCVDNLCLAGAVGDRCLGDYQCDPENWCDPTNTCQPDLPTGSVCTDDDQCAVPESCVGDDLEGATNGTCMRSATAGDPCDGTCRAFLGYWCNQPSPVQLGTCEPRRKENESCNPDTFSCELALHCEPQLSVCLPAGGPGTPCVNENDCNFYAGLHCSTVIDGGAVGQCEAPRELNARCLYDSHCASGYCLQEVCTAVNGCY